MKLPNPFSRKSAAIVMEERYFLALIITNVTVQAGLWKVAGGTIAVQSISSTQSYSDEKTLLVAADKALQELGKESEKTDEVVFGFELDWVDSVGIRDDKKPLLKSLSSELSLKPVGFVVIPEALLHSLQKKDPHCSLLLIQVAAHQLTVTLIRRGLIIVSERVGRSSDSISDVVEAIARFNEVSRVGGLPGKIIIAGVGIQTKVIRELQQELLGYTWPAHYDFVHTPVVEVYPEEMVVTSVIQEGGRAVAEAQGLLVGLDAEAVGEPESQVDTGTAEPIDLDTHQSPVQKSFGIPISMPFNSASPIGSDSDLEQGAQRDQVLQSDVVPVKQVSNPEDMYSASEVKQVSPMIKKQTTTRSKQGGGFQTVWKFHQKQIMGGFFAGIVVLAILALGSVFLFKNAVVTLDLREEFVSKEVAVTLDSSISDSNPAELLLKAEPTSTTVSGSDSIAASGIKLVGEKAKGTVTIFNKTDSSKTFEAGTELRSGNLRFVLDEEVQVASASVEENSSQGSETRVFGKVTVSATAQDIGAEFNIANDTELQVETFASSTYTAITESTFSGGSSREVRVVSEEDRQKVMDNLKEKLIGEAKTVFKDQARNGNQIIPTGQVEVVKATYDAAVGEEVSSLELEAELEVFAVSYAQDDIRPLVETVLNSELPEGYALSEEDPSILTDNSGNSATDSGTARVSIDLNISTKALPVLDNQMLKNSITGKVIEEASSILRDTRGIESAEVRLRPGFIQIFSKSLPTNPDKIRIEVLEEE